MIEWFALIFIVFFISGFYWKSSIRVNNNSEYGSDVQYLHLKQICCWILLFVEKKKLFYLILGLSWASLIIQLYQTALFFYFFFFCCFSGLNDADSDSFHNKQVRVIKRKAYKLLWKLIIVSRKLVTHEREQKRKEK